MILSLDNLTWLVETTKLKPRGRVCVCSLKQIKVLLSRQHLSFIVVERNSFLKEKHPRYILLHLPLPFDEGAISPHIPPQNTIMQLRKSLTKCHHASPVSLNTPIVLTRAPVSVYHTLSLFLYQ